MTCLIPILSVCLLDPSNIVLEGQMSGQVSGGVQYSVGGPQSGYHLVTGPVGRAALSVVVPIDDWFELSYGIEHRSIISTAQDRGEERAFVGFYWRPWKEGSPWNR